MISQKIVAKYGTAISKCMKKNEYYKSRIQRRMEKILGFSFKTGAVISPQLSFLIEKNRK